MRALVLVGFVGLWAAGLSAAPVQITTHAQVPVAHSSSRIVSGTLDLPGDGVWQVAEIQGDNVPVEVYMRTMDEAVPRMMGRRMRKVASSRNLQRGRSWLSSLYWGARSYAVTNGGYGPVSVDQLDAGIATRIGQSPWRGAYADIDGPFVFLIPEAHFLFRDVDRHVVPREQRARLAFELRPFVDDGKHWVLYTDGSSERESIDPALVAQHGQDIRPVTRQIDENRPAAAEQRYLIMAVLPATAPDNFVLTVRNTMQNIAQDVIWQVDQHVPVEHDLKNALDTLRARHWAHLESVTASAILAGWDHEPFAGDRRNGGGATASIFGMLGGRPAIEETLQMGLLQAAPDQGERTIGIESIAGVTVQSHPYAKMLGEANVRTPDILMRVPADHLVLYVPKPAAILPLLDSGADFIGGLGATTVGSSIRYGLKDRYLARLGMDQAWLETLLKTGVVREFALFAPDMFFIDGTDLTVVARITQPALLAGVLRLIQIDRLGEKVLPLRTASGHDAFWTMKEDLLFVSTSQHEMQQALRLLSDPSDSLAHSVEYQYMLTQVPLQESTRMMLYFSDPFIRRLVSPAVKIGQLRRALARARMEVVTTAALRANLDGIDSVDLPLLVRLGYLPDSFDGHDISLEPDGRAVSGTYGTLADPVPLSAVAMDHVTSAEAAAYERYLENYNRFWRQFFDPIAIRLDDAADGGLEMTTFILPLIDNSLYDNIKALLVQGDGDALRIPTAKPDPVLMLSLHLTESAWIQIAEMLSEMFTRFIRISPQAMDDLGPALHFAIYDSDPVIALGSGDIFGAFGGGSQMFRRGEMFAIPMALSVLTRPCAFMVETRDPARTARFLDRAASSTMQQDNTIIGDFQAEFYRIDHENTWVYTFSVLGMINVRFGIAIEGDYVVVRNIPWSSRDRILRVADSPLNAARLAIQPSAGEAQIPGLHASAMEKQRYASLEGIGRLYPVMLARNLGVGDAVTTHAHLFGFQPVHPGTNTWLGDARTLHSPMFGSVYQQQQPAYRANHDNFGLFQNIAHLNVSMAFEGSGLRSVLQWKTGK